MAMTREQTAALLQLLACIGAVVALGVLLGWAGIVLALAWIAYQVGEDLS